MAATGKALGVGLTLHADWTYLEHVAPLLDAVDFIEIAPETTWGVRPDGRLVFNAFADYLDGITKPVAAHGLGYSPGTVSTHPADARETARWLEMIAASHARFDFTWYLDHIGFARHSGRTAVLPLPLFHDDASVAAVARAMDALRAIHPFPGFENAVWYFSPNADEAGFLARLVRESGAWLLLDAHNVYTACVNGGLDWQRYVDRLPLERVLCMHLSGGSVSDAAWQPGGRVYRLDSHDDTVPETVWDIAAYAARRAPNLRGIILERLDGTFTPDDLPRLRAELDRARNLWNELEVAPVVAPLTGPAAEISLPEYAQAGRADTAPPPHAAKNADAVDAHAATRSEAAAAARQLALLDALHAVDPIPALRDILSPDADLDGIRITSLLVQKLRFERLMRGDSGIGGLFDADPQTFVRDFERYQRQVPSTAFFPAEEARDWRAWRAAEGNSNPLRGAPES